MMFCDRKEDGICPAGTFNANARSPNDCIDCFCFGVTKECSSTELFTVEVNHHYQRKTTRNL